MHAPPPEPPGSLEAGDRFRFDDEQSCAAALVRAALVLSREHDLERLLEVIVGGAAEVIHARYSALAIYDDEGTLQRFVHHGVDPATADAIGAGPRGLGLLGEALTAEGPIRSDDLGRDIRSVGFPAGHPPMRTFLGVPLASADRRFGNLYLAEKRSGGSFTDEDEGLVVTFAAFAVAALEGAELVDAERRLAAATERVQARDEMMRRVIEAQEAERARVARDLHDQIGQSLTSVLLGLRLVESALPAAPGDELRSRFDEVRDLVATSLNDVRRLAFELRPTVLDDIGLRAALERLARETSERNGVDVVLTFEGLGPDDRVGQETETVVYRVVQEALTNVVRHSGTYHATVTVSSTTGSVHARVGDEGRGFEPPSKPLTTTGSLGLAGMAERAALVGGRLTIDTTPGGGTVVSLDVPHA